MGKSSLYVRRIIFSLFLVLSYLSCKVFYLKVQTDGFIILELGLLIGILSISGALEYIGKALLTNYERINTRPLLMLLLFWLLGISLLYTPGYTTTYNFRNIVALYLALLPTLWLFKADYHFPFYMALVFLSCTALFINDYLPTSDITATLTYLWLATSVIIKFVKHHHGTRYQNS